jgi:hypothetical protein
MAAKISMWTEPAIVDVNDPPKYPYGKMWVSESQHSIQLDDTPTKERVRVQHRDGSFQEFQPKGDVVTKVLGNNYQITAGDNNVLIEGQCNITVNGACVIHIMNDGLIQVDGNLQQVVNGDLDQVVNGKTSINGVGDIDIASQGDIGLYASSINIDGDLNVSGSVTAEQSISALMNITAGMQSSALLGFVTPGFISAGSPVPLFPLPGWISGIMVSDIQGTMMTMRLQYDIHTHIGNLGAPTSPPLIPMI